MQLEDIKKLAETARIDMAQDEMEDILSTFPSILSYIKQIDEISLEPIDISYSDTNKLREDIVTNMGGLYSKDIISQMPDSDHGYLKVKQIL